MQAERFVRQPGYVGDQLRTDAGAIKNLALAVFGGLLVMLIGMRVLPEESTPLLVKVMGMLSASIAMGAVGAYVGRNIQGWLPIIGLGLALMAGVFIIPALGGGVLGTTALMGFGFVGGMTLGPLVSFALAEEGPGIVIQALTGTTAVMLVTGFIAMASGIDFSFLGPIFLLAVLGMVIFGLIGIFVRFSRRVSLIYSLFGIAIFSLGFLYKFFQLTKAENTWDMAVRHTMSLYLTFLNLFSFILQFLLSNKRR
jgi:FtsH-binding integral membrane protein